MSLLVEIVTFGIFHMRFLVVEGPISLSPQHSDVVQAKCPDLFIMPGMGPPDSSRRAAQTTAGAQEGKIWWTLASHCQCLLLSQKEAGQS